MDISRKSQRTINIVKEITLAGKKFHTYCTVTFINISSLVQNRMAFQGSSSPSTLAALSRTWGHCLFGFHNKINFYRMGLLPNQEGQWLITWVPATLRHWTQGLQ